MNKDLIPEQFRVYKAWPVDVIRQADEEFRDMMFDSASSEELRAGMSCLDFLTRASDVPEDLASMIDAHISEAEMRIMMMDAKEAQEQENDKNIHTAIKSVYHLHRQMNNILQNARMAGSDYVYSKFGAPDFDKDDEDELM